jgi:predicted transcriptional regulator
MMKLIDVPYIRTYHDLTDLEQQKMIDYYASHSLKECAAKWKISERDGLPQFLTRGNPKMSKGGARTKAVIPKKTEYELHKEYVIERLGKDGKALILKLLKLHDDNTGNIKSH